MHSLSIWWLETFCDNLQCKESGYGTEKKCLLQLHPMVCLVSYGEWFFIWVASAQNRHVDQVCIELLI